MLIPHSETQPTSRLRYIRLVGLYIGRDADMTVVIQLAAQP